MRSSDYPKPVVVLACEKCQRYSRYSLGRAVYRPCRFHHPEMQFAPLGETALIFGYALVFSLGVNDLAKMALINRRAQPAGEALEFLGAAQ